MLGKPGTTISEIYRLRLAEIDYVSPYTSIVKSYRWILDTPETWYSRSYIVVVALDRYFRSDGAIPLELARGCTCAKRIEETVIALERSMSRFLPASNNREDLRSQLLPYTARSIRE